MSASPVATTTSRRFGIALMGLFIGAFAGFAVHEIMGAILLGIFGAGAVSGVGVGMMLFYLTPVGAIAGLLAALRLDTKRRQLTAGSQ